ncbi:MAG: methylated-DNA--[protein]-cysteine S-methyltransferase [Pirellulales bacterium]
MLTTTIRADQTSAESTGTNEFDHAADRTCIASFLTELGWMAVAWRDDVLVGNSFGHASRRAAELVIACTPGLPEAFCRFDVENQADELPAWVADLIDRLERFAIGEPVEFANVPVAQDHLTPFGRKVAAACRRITWGQSRTYGELAIECGSSGAARAVGSVMAKNRYPLIVPCHRVLAAGGALGGYSAPEGLKMKRRLLEMESSSWPRRAK